MECIKIEVGNKIDVLTSSVACIGYFDGVHLGHQKLIKKVLERSEILSMVPSCICFDEDPWIVMNKIENPAHITPFQKRLEVLEALGIERVFLLHFDEAMRTLSVCDFIKMLEDMQIKELICGDDFRFAYKGEGNIQSLKQGNFNLIVENFVIYHDFKVSSSFIEKDLLAGKIKEANLQLGYTYNLNGVVVHGRGIGEKQLSFPTINVKLKELYILPKIGVYAGFVKINNTIHKAMINIGKNPTLSNLENLSIEAHILNYNGDLYGSSVVLYFSEFIREECKFDNKEQLIEQLKKDCNYVENWEGELVCV